MAGRNLSDELIALQQTFPQASPQQRAQAQHLSYGALRFYLGLRHCLTALLDKPIKDPLIENLLLVAMYQLHYDQAPAHTVVNQAVQAMQTLKKTWAKGLVNALLRNFIRQQPALIQSLQNQAETQWNYPSWWIQQLSQEYPDSWQQILHTGNQHPPMTLRVNARKLSGLDYQQRLQQQQIDSQLLDSHSLLLQQAMPVDALPGFADGLVSVQDYGAQQSAKLLRLQDGLRVLDACAAPGGKSCQILESADVELLALDIAPARLARVNSNLQRLQLTGQTQLADAAQVQQWWDGKPFDRILIDAPCSASGVVRRHVDIKWLRRPSDIASFAQQQAHLLNALWPLLAPGGLLLYVTCSLFAAENQLQVNNFLQSHADALNLALDGLPQNLQMQQGQLIPNQYHDGLFYALLQKT